MTLMDTAQLLGNFGEFVGAIAVVFTLAYLAVQVRHSKEATEANTRMMEENRKLALAQNFVQRAGSVEQAFRDEALSESMSKIILKARTEGIDALDDLEEQRLRSWAAAQVNRLDSQYYQYQQDLLDEDGYFNFRRAIRLYAPIWKRLGLRDLRPPFEAEIEAILNPG